MASSRQEFTVEYENGDTQTVIADQRDYAMFEGEYRVGTQDAAKTMPMVFFRAVAFFALRRTGAIAATTDRKAWDLTVIESMPEGDGDDEDVNPTNPEASDTAQSSLPSKAVRASGRSANGGRPKTS